MISIQLLCSKTFVDHCFDQKVLSDSSHRFLIFDVSDQTSVVHHQEKYYDHCFDQKVIHRISTFHLIKNIS
jgi:hypothetical protein